MENSKIKFITRTGILLALALVVQMGGFPQPVTGPLINTVLYLAALLVNGWSGAMIGIFTPAIAFFRGILPPPLAPMIPFIALGNAVLALVFAWMMKKNQILAVVVASVIKYIVLSAAVGFIVSVPGKIAQMMGLPQLITALVGGGIALIVFKALKSIGIDKAKKVA